MFKFFIMFSILVATTLPAVVVDAGAFRGKIKMRSDNCDGHDYPALPGG